MPPAPAPPAAPSAFAVRQSAPGRPYRVSAWCLLPRDAPRRARRLLRSRLIGLSPAVVDDLELVLSELASNAVTHAPGPYELRILYEDGLPIRVEVADSGNSARTVDRLLHRPGDAFAAVDTLADGGRGLRIVAACTGGWCGARQVRLYGTGRLGTGVWFSLPTPGIDTLSLIASAASG
ncbi:Histidine kinase-like ATPase domain-containing protein [Sinosporangium album]|uniref:Histidine kinase-like ATPase domain-containing protein n=1 Tax=Sinosporangium album TaxID=504805 RepID=A0A1G8HZ33_9ACTN|nr:ATP-binding protein [Sinosporangium album]SDI11887.1 Histidine kinase-like ATPase domain-containing protein [Sinosporangium album]